MQQNIPEFIKPAQPPQTSWLRAINYPVFSYNISNPNALLTKNQVKLLFVFYKSTLTLSIASSAMLAFLSFMNPVFMLLAFGICILSAGTVITLLYKETSKRHEYYFFYNMGLSRLTLLLTCALGNLIIGTAFIVIYIYA